MPLWGRDQFLIGSLTPEVTTSWWHRWDPTPVAITVSKCFLHDLCRLLTPLGNRFWDSLRAGRSVVRIALGAKFSVPVHISRIAHLASYAMVTGSFQGVKRPGRGADPPSSTEVAIPVLPFSAWLGMPWVDPYLYWYHISRVLSQWFIICLFQTEGWIACRFYTAWM